jgi:endoglucanase
MRVAAGLLVAGLLFSSQALFAGTETPFSRGVNLSGWLQADSPGQIAFNRYSRGDFEHIRNLGCDVIRLPINLHFMTSGAPDYTLDPLFLKYLDEVVDWAEELQIHLLLDNHTFDPAVETDPAVGDILEKVWLQMAEHYKHRSGFIHYEVMNEPHGISDELWNSIQAGVVDVIRSVDTEHTIIIGPANWNSYANLENMPVYEDDNLIYTFHFYDPFLFTHQGATWGSPSMGELAGVPFPYRAEDMPELPASLEGTWVADAYHRYPEEGTVEKLFEVLDTAIQFGLERDVPLLAGEFGVLMYNAPEDDRIEWYRVVREHLEANGVAWTSWDYHGGFGLFENGSQGEFGHDLNVPLLEALGLNVPPQTARVEQPALTGFNIYTDAPEGGALTYGSAAGIFDVMSAEHPREGTRAIRWTGAGSYGAFGFDFQPDLDLQYLVDRGYGLNLQIRGNLPSGGISVRFMDSDTEEPDDRPWRMGLEIDQSRVTWNGDWHQVYVPLAELEEQGAWEAGAWYGPEGKFDWSAVDRLEFSSGIDGLDGIVVGIDDVRIVAANPGSPRLTSDAGASGLFYDSATPGHGFDFNVLDAGLVVYYYGHTNSGERLWLISEPFSGDLEFNQPFELEFFELPEGAFGSPVESYASWGTIRFTLESCTTGFAQFDGVDGTLDMRLERLAGLPGLGCSR